MTAETQLTLHTVPSTWMHRERPPTPEPYQRVVGVTTGLGHIACEFPVEEPITEQTFTVPQSFADRLFAFFDEHLAWPDPQDPAGMERVPSPDGTFPSFRYNCHTFAMAMLGLDEGSIMKNLAALRAMVQDYVPADGNLPTGEHGVLWHPGIQRLGQKMVAHSVIGMGLDVPLGLQVVNNNSNLALMPYDLMRRSFTLFEGYEFAATASSAAQMQR